jgi:hypothetical protein
MPTFVLTHRHAPEECPVAFAAWKGFESPLRQHATISSCASTNRQPESGDHIIWWTVEAADPAAALALLPPYIAERTEITEAGDVPIP